jgi:DNA-binding SARP family transcriptional activator
VPLAYAHEHGSSVDDPLEDDFADRARGVTVRVQTFGAWTVDVGNNRLGRNADIIATLLLLLSHAPGMQMPRDTLTSALWPDTPDTRRRANLRQALYKLRQLGVRATMRGDQVELDPAQVERNFSIDRSIGRFDSDVLRGHEPFGAFLPNFHAEPGSVLAEWIDHEREKAHGDARRVLASALNTRHALADWRGAEPLARWLLQFDPLNEVATMVMAECLVLSGAKYEATKLLDHYLSEIGPGATDLRIPATTLRRRISAPAPRRISFAPSERHFIGREPVMADLTLCMRRARFNDGTATLLHGSAGMGKTRVVNELIKVATLEGTRDARTGCRETDVTRPLSIFLEIVPDLMAMSGALGCSPESLHALRRFTNVDAGVTVERAPGAVLDMPLAAGLRRSIVDLITAVADEKPLLLVLEDVHWLDSASWEVLVDLIDRIAESRVCLLMTSRVPHARPVPPSRALLALSIRPLPPLSLESSLELARAIGTDLSAQIDDELGEWFIHAAEGVPLFLRSLVNHWIETGHAGGVPPTLLGIIGQRLQSLSSDALRVLQTVALLDRHASLPMIERVLELPCFRVVNALDDLHKAGAFDSEVEDRIVCHELIGKMAVDGLGRNTRRALHKHIAEILHEKLATDRSPLVYRDRLEHLLRSGDTPKFLEASNEAVRDLLAAGFSYDALGVAEAALQHASEPEMRGVVLALQSEALYSCGEYARLLRHPLSPATVGQGLSRWHDAEPEALVRWLDSAFYADRGSNASEICAAAILVAEDDRNNPATKFAAATLALRIAGNTCDMVAAERAYLAGHGGQTALLITDRQKNELEVLFHTIFGDAELALAAAKSLLVVGRTTPNVSEKLDLFSIVAFAIRVHGDPSEAANIYREMFAIALREKIAGKGWFAAWRLSGVALEKGDIAEATNWMDEYARMAPVDREPLAAMMLHVHSARIAIARNNPDLAASHELHARGTMEQGCHLKRYAHWLAISLAISRLRNDVPSILDQLELAIHTFEKVRTNVTQDFFAGEIARSLVLVGRGEEARSLLRAYRDNYRRDAAPFTIDLISALALTGIED